MKFVSKNPTLRVMLRSEISANSLSGYPGQRGLSYRFVDGVVEVTDPEHIELMKKHSDFNVMFIAVGEDEVQKQDPYAKSRPPAEPPHAMTELKFGTPVSTTKVPQFAPYPQEIEQKINELADQRAVELMKAALPGLLKEALQSIAGASKESTKESSGTTVSDTSKKRRGRPPKQKQVEDAKQPEETREIPQ